MSAAAIPSPKGEMLKPCPFCGGTASRQDLTDDDNAGGSCITCDSCGASSPVHFDRKENLYDSWNRRSSSSREEVLREALEKIRDHWATDYNHAKAETEMYRGAYGTGVVDGHRAAAIIAREALAALSQGE